MSIGILYRECATCADNVSLKVNELLNKNSVGSIAERSLNPGISRATRNVKHIGLSIKWERWKTPVLPNRKLRIGISS